MEPAGSNKIDNYTNMEKAFTRLQNTQEAFPAPRVEIEPAFADFAPQEFLADPLGYFERTGKNIKTGAIKYDEAGKVREDPTAVKDLPVWRNASGQEIAVVGRRVNTAKGAVQESGDPFYEYGVLQRLAQLDLPAARPIAKAEQGGVHLIVMERIPGIRWSEKEQLELKGYSAADVDKLLEEAQWQMADLEERFTAAGVLRSWKLKDMVFQIDVENKKIDSLTPTDWERTKIREDKKE